MRSLTRYVDRGFEGRVYLGLKREAEVHLTLLFGSTNGVAEHKKNVHFCGLLVEAK